jgi:hypothetical protein
MAFALARHLNKTQIISLSCLTFINFLFTWKYIDRVTSWALPIAIIYSIGLSLLVSYLPSAKIKEKWVTVLTLLILCILSFLLFQKIDPLDIKVDRWSVITSFWDSAFQGEYPYFAKSHRQSPPGPFPIYFLLGLPFYLLGEIGWLSVIGIVIFLLFIRKKIAKIEYLKILFFTILSIAVWYEILVRSTIFANSAILLSLLYLIRNYTYKNYKVILLTALLAGVLLSTRMVFGLCYAVYLIHGLRTKQISWPQAITWGAVCILTFLLTLAPFYFLFPDDFWVQNPFNIQGTFLIQPYWQPVFLVMAIALGFFCKSNKSLIFNYGLILFSVIMIYIGTHLIETVTDGTFIRSERFWDGGIDISYLLFSLPFFILHSYSTDSSKAPAI